jgi:hypothetical protein
VHVDLSKRLSYCLLLLCSLRLGTGRGTAEHEEGLGMDWACAQLRFNARCHLERRLGKGRCAGPRNGPTTCLFGIALRWFRDGVCTTRADRVCGAGG